MRPPRLTHLTARRSTCHKLGVFRMVSEMDIQVIPANSSAPQILEIGQVPRMHHAYPSTTEFFSTYVMDSERSRPSGSELVSAKTLVQLAKRMSEPGLDLVVVHASPHGSLEGLIRTVFRRSTLHGHVPL